MKKLLAMILAVVLGCLLCACNVSTSRRNNAADGDSGNSEMKERRQMEGMEILCDSESLTDCYTNDGYYYLAEDAVELKDGEYGTQLMYMDFAAQQEIVLCSNTGCKHNTTDCPAVFLLDEFPFMSCGMFVYKEKLYILSKDYDNDGAVSHNYSMDGEGVAASTEASQAVLYEMNLDGTNRHKVYTFDADLMVEDTVLGDDDGFYFVTKKLSNTMGEDYDSVTTSTDKALMFLNMETQDVNEICSFNFDDGIAWKISGCFGNTLVLEGTDYGKELTVDDYTLDDDAWKELYKNSSDVTAVFDLKTNTLTEKYRIDNTKEHSVAVMERMLYVSYADTNEVKAVDLENGEEKTLCSLSQNLIMDTFENMLCCRDWDMTSDYTYYFINTETGEIQNSALVNESVGWSLEFKAEVGSRVLAVYDYEAEALEDGAYDITQYKYALIEKEDLYAGNASYHPIQMIARGR